MIDINNFIILVIISLNFIVFILGYLCGKIGYNNNSETNTNYSSNTFSKNSKKNFGDISIDETKVVTKIVTDKLEKKFDDLGETKVSSENITSSVNKLKNMKG